MDLRVEGGSRSDIFGYYIYLLILFAVYIVRVFCFLFSGFFEDRCVLGIRELGFGSVRKLRFCGRIFCLAEGGS